MIDDDTLRESVEAVVAAGYNPATAEDIIKAAAPILTAAKDRRIAELEAALSTVVMEHDGYFSTAEAWRVARSALAGSAVK